MDLDHSGVFAPGSLRALWNQEPDVDLFNCEHFLVHVALGTLTIVRISLQSACLLRIHDSRNMKTSFFGIRIDSQDEELLGPWDIGLLLLDVDDGAFRQFSETVLFVGLVAVHEIMRFQECLALGL